MFKHWPPLSDFLDKPLNRLGGTYYLPDRCDGGAVQRQRDGQLRSPCPRDRSRAKVSFYIYRNIQS